MNIGAGEILLLGSVAILAYFFIAEVIKQTREKDWTLVIILALIIAIGIGFLVISYFNRSKLTEEELDDDEEIEEMLMQNDYDESMESKPIHNEGNPEVELPDDLILDSTVQIEIGEPVESEVSQMDYVQFKQICFTKPFLLQMSESLKKSLRMKHALYLKYKITLKKELKTFGKQDDSLAGMISNLKNETLQGVRSALEQVEKLLKEIPIRIKSTNPESVRRGLKQALYDPNNGLDTVIGRREIKDFLALRLYSFSKNPKVFMSTFQHMAIYGPSGYGKTRIATTIGHVYASIGLLFRGSVISMTKSNMVSPFVNETAQKTKTLLLSTLESVVFMDEAYDITPPRSMMGNIDHGHEAITELVNFTDKTIGMNLIIVAGYEEQTKEQFMASNQGLPRRFPHEVVLQPYNGKELTAILLRFLRETNPDLHLEKEMVVYIYTLMINICSERPDLFDKQAGAMQNLASEISHCILGSEQGFTKPVVRSGFNKFLSGLGSGIVER